MINMREQQHSHRADIHLSFSFLNFTSAILHLPQTQIQLVSASFINLSSIPFNPGRTMASSSTARNQSDPLIPPKFSNEQPPPLSSTTVRANRALSFLRIGLGASTLIAPQWTCALFQMPIPATMSVIVRLFAIRDIMLGELLITAEDKKSPTRGRREIKRALLANIGSDAVDICSIGFALATGTIGRVPGALFGGGAAVFLGLGILGLNGL
jgi:hypothetical protein